MPGTPSTPPGTLRWNAPQSVPSSPWPLPFSPARISIETDPGPPVLPNSARIIASVAASIGANKHLGFNLDMNFVIVSPNQPRVPVKILLYPAESDPGPFPVPANAPIENWPLAHN
jgi:hypothetical protein